MSNSQTKGSTSLKGNNEVDQVYEITPDNIDYISDADLHAILAAKYTTKSREAFQHVRKSHSKLNTSEIIFISICLMDREIFNWGFHHFYMKNKDLFAFYLPEALRSIGANEYAKLILNAHNFYIMESAITKDKTAFIKGGISEINLDRFHTQYNELVKRHDLFALLIAYVRKNKADFLTESK